MVKATTPDFDDAEGVTSNDLPIFNGTTADIDAEVEDDKNLDVDLPDDTDEVPSAEVATDTAATPAKATRPKAPEGYVKPVEFAKHLGEHLGKTVPPQVVYSYIKNNQGEGARNPFPTHEIGGYAWYIKPEEGLAWWDAKNDRVTAAKAATVAKAAAKAAAPAAPTEAEGPVTEAE